MAKGPDWNDLHRTNPGGVRDALTEPDVPIGTEEAPKASRGNGHGAAGERLGGKFRRVLQEPPAVRGTKAGTSAAARSCQSHSFRMARQRHSRAGFPTRRRHVHNLAVV